MRAALAWGLGRIGAGALLTLALLLVTAAIVAQGIATLVKSLDAPLLFSAFAPIASTNCMAAFTLPA